MRVWGLGVVVVEGHVHVRESLTSSSLPSFFIFMTVLVILCFLNENPADWSLAVFRADFGLGCLLQWGGGEGRGGGGGEPQVNHR